MEQIRQLGSLRDAGVLTADEFEVKKAELLKRI
ncbi:MAG: SHOCT domain-containing protein [Terricaulis sp.]